MHNNFEFPSSHSLQIAIIGAGGIGSTLAFQFSRTGLHAVTVIARSASKRLYQLQHDAGIVNVKGERAVVSICDMLDENIPYDLVVITVQAHRLDTLIPTLQRSAAKCVLFMSNNFHPEQLIEAIGRERCTFGMPFFQAVVDSNGRLVATIGAGGQKSKLGHQHLVNIFKAAGLPSVFEPEMLLWLRCHVPFCIAFESISVAATRRKSGASWSEAMVIAYGVKESFSLIQKLGYRLYPPGKARLNASPAWVVAAMLWCMSRIKSFRELLATGIHECRALIDVLVATVPQKDTVVSVKRIEAMKPAWAPKGD